MNRLHEPALAATLLRWSLGTMWISQALLKWLVFTLPGFAQFLQSHGLPAAAAVPVFALELLGGGAILLGVGARYASLALLPVMLVAGYTHLPNGWVFNAPNGGWEYPAFLLVASIASILLGDGRYALLPGPASRRTTPARH